MDSTEANQIERTNTWTTEDDQFMAGIVLKTVRAGGTQLDAFQIAAQQLGRTPAACGFRWNGRLRHMYRTELESAKRERRHEGVPLSAMERNPSTRVESAIAMHDAMRFLRSFDREYKALLSHVQILSIERDQLQARVDELEQQVKARELETLPTPERIQEDAQLLAEIAIRARKVLGKQKG